MRLISEFRCLQGEIVVQANNYPQDSVELLGQALEAIPTDCTYGPRIERITSEEGPRNTPGAGGIAQGALAERRDRPYAARGTRASCTTRHQHLPTTAAANLVLPRPKIGPHQIPEPVLDIL